jgi:hypothetical protein
MELLDHGSGDAIGFPQGDIAFVLDWIEDEGLIVNEELFWRLTRKLMPQPLAVQIRLLGRDLVRNAGSACNAEEAAGGERNCENRSKQLLPDLHLIG